MAQKVTIQWEQGEVSGWQVGDGADGVVLAHGAGTNQDHPFMVALRDALAASGLTVLTFNYPYTERGSRSPDRAPKLIACHRGAVEFLRPQVDRLVLAGRSMGGRMATLLVAEGVEATGVILYAYPLHPAGKPEKLRISHFDEVNVPLLFFQGTRDSLSRMELFDRHIRPLPNATVDILEGANHGFRGGGWTQESMVDHLATRSMAWIAGLPSGKTVKAGP